MWNSKRNQLFHGNFCVSVVTAGGKWRGDWTAHSASSISAKSITTGPCVPSLPLIGRIWGGNQCVTSLWQVDPWILSNAGFKAQLQRRGGGGNKLGKHIRCQKSWNQYTLRELFSSPGCHFSWALSVSRYRPSRSLWATASHWHETSHSLSHPHPPPPPQKPAATLPLKQEPQWDLADFTNLSTITVFFNH